MSNKISVNECRLYDLPKFSDSRGSLSFVEGNEHIPFEIKRVFYLYDIQSGESRGAHAHKNLHQFLICLAGSFDLEIDDGTEKKIIHLDEPSKGIHIPPMIWATEINFAPGSVCLALVSDVYVEEDYIRDYDQFILTSQSD